MDDKTHSTFTEFDGETATPTSWNGGRQDPEQHLPSSRLHRGAPGSALARESLTVANGMSRLLRVEEVASLLNVPRKWVYRRVGLKPPHGIPYVKVGKYLRFRESDLRDYVERLRRN
jgi:excisionase family DNA binding protein